VSSTSFAQTNYGLNQSYFLTDDGSVHTVRSYKPTEDFINLFSPNGFFILPEDIVLSKSSYLIDDDNNLYTVDTNGYFYKYTYSTKIGSKIKHAGESFFITRDRKLHIILSNGTIKSIDKDNYDLDSRVKELGGNYLITRKNTVYIINPFIGSISNSGLEISRKDIQVLGDNFLVTEEGVVYSFGLKPDGGKVIKSVQNYRFKGIQKVAGNYFIANNGNIITIAINGNIDAGADLKGYSLISNPILYGANYFMLNDNSFYIVDQDGIFHMLEKFDKRIILTTK
jgi:cytochrome oxidase Cu insertion factor (SCO1/SenC/PrrC family)